MTSETISPLPRTRRISLSQLTVDPVSPTSFIDAAAAAGFRSVGLRLRAAHGAGVTAPGMSPSDVRDVRDRLRRTEVECSLVTGLWVVPDVDPRDYAPTLDIAAELGAMTVLVVVNDADMSRALARFRMLGDMAADRGLKLGLEYMAYTGLKTLAAASDFLRRAAVPDAAIILDALHIARAGDTVADVARLEPELVALVQLCDGSATPPLPEGLRNEARTGRLLPGEGHLPLHALLDALPPNLWIDVEAPTMREGSPLEKATRAATATAKFLEQHEARAPSARER